MDLRANRLIAEADRYQPRREMRAKGKAEGRLYALVDWVRVEYLWCVNNLRR